MNSHPVVPKRGSIRRALRWLSDNPPLDAPRIGEAARRFDLSPLDEAFLLREFSINRKSGKPNP